MTSDCMNSPALYCLPHLLSSLRVQKPCHAGCKDTVIIPAFKLFGFSRMRKESWEELYIRTIFLRAYYVMKAESLYILEEFWKFKRATYVVLSSEESCRNIQVIL